MRNSVLEESKKSSKTEAMLLMHATLPFMSAYVALPLPGALGRRANIYEVELRSLSSAVR